MRQWVIVFFISVSMVAGVSVPAYAARNCSDNMFDRAGDWFATRGKQGMDKSRILNKRKHDRFMACLQKDR